MGLSIHYSGSFRKEASLEEMIEEVKDIVEIYKWPYFIEENGPFPEKISGNHNGKVYGICFTPPECETISLSFLSNRRMSNDVLLKFYGNSKKKNERDFLYNISVKTQFAGSEIHKLIIHLLKYLSKKYFDNFELTDEGKYWETEDEQLLESIFNKYNVFLNSVENGIKSFPIEKGESFTTYFRRLMKKIKDEGSSGNLNPPKTD